MRNTVKANDSKMSRREVEILSLEWICSFCENNVCSAVQCCRLEFDDGWRAGWAKSLPTLSSIAFSTIHRTEKCRAKKIISRKSAATTTKSWNHVELI